MQTAADKWDAAQTADRQTGDFIETLKLHSLQTGAAAREQEALNRLERTASERRSEIERLRRVVSGGQQDLEKLRPAEQQEAEKLSGLQGERDRESVNFAREENPNPKQHDEVLARLDRDITRSSSRLAGLRKLIEEATEGVNSAVDALKPLERDEAEYAHHLFAQEDRKEIESLAAGAMEALAAKEKAEQQLVRAIFALRNRNHASEANRQFAALAAERLERRAAGIRV